MILRSMEIKIFILHTQCVNIFVYTLLENRFFKLVIEKIYLRCSRQRSIFVLLVLNENLKIKFKTFIQITSKLYCILLSR